MMWSTLPSFSHVMSGRARTLSSAKLIARREHSLSGARRKPKTFPLVMGYLRGMETHTRLISPGSNKPSQYPGPPVLFIGGPVGDARHDKGPLAACIGKIGGHALVPVKVAMLTPPVWTGVHAVGVGCRAVRIDAGALGHPGKAPDHERQRAQACHCNGYADLFVCH